jgi:SHAQKYF class myb-like DNA-binding protein
MYFNPYLAKKTSPLFSTTKPLTILKQRRTKLDIPKADFDITKAKEDQSLNRSIKSEELSKSETIAEVSIKNDDSRRNIDLPKQVNKFKSLKKRNFVQKEGHFNTGRWQQDEHERFIEAILKFGNEWKKVQKYVKTRSSTQARSHAQKFLYKVNKSNLLDLDINLTKNSLKSLHDLENKLEEDKFANAVKVLNLIGFEKTSSSKSKLYSRKIKIPTDDFITQNSKNPFSIPK